MSEVWAEGWEERLATAIHVRGYQSIADFLKSYPAVPYSELQGILMCKFAEVQMQRLQYDEAQARGYVSWAARDCLARKIVEHFPEGWRSGPEWQRTLLSALGSWASSITATGDLSEFREAVVKVGQSFRTSPPSEGWQPRGPDDQEIQARFEKFWPSDIAC